MEIFKHIEELQKTNFNDIKPTRRINFSNIISQKDFKSLFINEANIYLKNQNISDEFVIDDNNKLLLNMLLDWSYFKESTDYSLSKGFLILGTYGVGKTLILNTYCNLYNRFVETYNDGGKFKIIPAIDLKNSDPYYKGHVFVDDIGKEPNIVKDYGTTTKPSSDYFYRRYSINMLTIGTSNYNLESIADMYGESISDRFRQMFNIVILKGESKRR